MRYVHQSWSVARLNAVIEAQGDCLGHFATVLAAAEVHVGVWGLEGEHAEEGITDGNGAHVSGSSSGGVESGDQGSHAGP
jgi:hypothetical protein